MPAVTSNQESARTGVAGQDTGPALPPVAAIPVALVVAAKIVGSMAFAGRYGFQRDELYYLACARHLAWGYVDFPAVVPALARLNVLIFGTGVATLRLFSVLAGAMVIVLAALTAREMGGGPQAQTLTAFAVLFNPLILGANILFQTVSFDQLTWALVIYIAVRLLRTGDERLWPALGLACGLGLETKYTILALAIGLAAGLIRSPQRHLLRTRGPLVAAGIASLILLPNLIWQVQHSWPSLTYVLQHSGDTGTRLQFILETLLLLGPIGIPLAALGYRELFSQPWLRPVASASLLTPLLLLAVNGKSYYAGPVYPLLLAAGSVGAVRLFARHRLTFAVVLSLLTAVTGLLVPLALPVLPLRQAVSKGIISARKDYADMLGWQGIAADVARAYRGLPPGERERAAIVAANYGEAGAVDLYDAHRGPPPTISGDLTYALWKPARVPDSTVVAVGFPRWFMDRYYRSVTLSSRIRMPYGVQNEEAGLPILICRNPRTSFAVFFAHIRGWG